MSDPVVCATQTVCDGLVVRWHRTLKGEPVVSASRNAVMVHGSVTVDDDLKLWILAAEDARELIRAGRLDEVRSLATHAYAGLFSVDLVPVERAEAAP